jgi:hypothetical protein
VKSDKVAHRIMVRPFRLVAEIVGI